MRERLGDAPVYVSIDIDVLDPGFAPGTGTPEAGGLTNRELLGILRGLAGVHLVGADIVEVAPPYDHAEVTAVAASHAAYELLGVVRLGTRPSPRFFSRIAGSAPRNRIRLPKIANRVNVVAAITMKTTATAAIVGVNP